MKPEHVTFLIFFASALSMIIGFAVGFFFGMHVADDDGPID